MKMAKEGIGRSTYTFSLMFVRPESDSERGQSD